MTSCLAWLSLRGPLELRCLRGAQVVARAALHIVQETHINSTLHFATCVHRLIRNTKGQVCTLQIVRQPCSPGDRPPCAGLMQNSAHIHALELCILLSNQAIQQQQRLEFIMPERCGQPSLSDSMLCCDYGRTTFIPA